LKRVAVLALTAAVFMASCAPLNFYKKVDTAIMSGQYSEADAIIEKEKNQYKGEHELLYYFDKGAILQMLGDYKASTQNLEKAELKIDELFTKSVTKELSSYFSNDLNLPYEGEDFEQVAVNIIKCLNFMYLGDFDGALVEAKKVDHRLNVLSDRNEGKNVYKEDAFARYLSGIAYEAKGEINDAYIAYRKAYGAYLEYNRLFGIPVPQEVKKDVLRTADAMKFYDDVERFQKDFGNIKYEKNSEFKDNGELIVVVHAGMAPFKSTKYTDHREKMKDGTISDVIRVAFPVFVPRGYVVSSVSAEGVKGFLAQDVATLAVKTLENKNFLISAKAIARAVAKYTMTKAIDNKGKNRALGLLAGIYSVASEQADTRSWRTLPAAFHILRLKLEPGRHEIRLNMQLSGGGSREQVMQVEIKKGRKKVVPVYVLN